MSTNDAGMSDETSADLNPADEPAPEGQPPTIPHRPADGAAKAKWVDYCVALGADRALLLGESEHFDPAAEVTRTKRSLISPHAGADPDFYEDVASLIDDSAAAGQSADDFAARMRSLYEDAQRRAEAASADPEYREVEVTEHGGMVRSEAFTREQLIELADRLGG